MIVGDELLPIQPGMEANRPGHGTICLNRPQQARLRQAQGGKIKNAAEKKQQRILYASENQTARSTLLERRHLVQAYTWQGIPFTTALTRFTLGFHSRLERLWEWETLIPKVTPLPQKSHFAIHCTSHPNDYFIGAPIRALVYDSRLFPKMQAFFCNFFEFEKDVDIPPKAGIMKDMM